MPEVGYWFGVRDGHELHKMMTTIQRMRDQRNVSLLWVTLALVALLAVFAAGQREGYEPTAVLSMVLWAIILIIDLARARNRAKREDETRAELTKWIGARPQLLDFPGVRGCLLKQEQASGE